MDESFFTVEYAYSSRNSVILDAALTALQKEIGGHRRPWGLRSGALDLVTFLELTLIFVASNTLPEYVKSYLAGLMGVEEAKKLGEKHRGKILPWLDEVRQRLQLFVASAEKRFREGLEAGEFEGTEMPIAICIELGQHPCFIVLNGRHVTHNSLERLSHDIVRMFRYIAEVGLPEESTVLQLCLDPVSQDWRYLLVPSHRAFGQYVDRIIDLSTNRLFAIHSAKEFVELLDVSQADRYQYLVNPFRDLAAE
ncbi:MAG: hypothetical protein WC712_11045 [Candidatus Brocadiia bacterium]